LCTSLFFLFWHILLTEFVHDLYRSCLRRQRRRRDDEDHEDDDDNDENSDTHNEDNEEDDNESYNENEYDENQDEDNTMPPKLKPVALQSPKKAKSKEPQVEKLTSAVSKKLNITASPPPVKPYSMMTLDGYIVKPYS
jgi:hypothetical protein